MIKAEEDMTPCKFKVGDKVVYDGLLAIIDRISPVYNYAFWLLSLTSVEDEEMTCTAKESECRLYDEPTFDTKLQRRKLSEARYESHRIMMIGESLTDKYFRDGNH